MKVKNRVKRFLQKYRQLRDNDNKLIATFWWRELRDKGKNIDKLSAEAFLSLYARGDLTNAESIRRIRAKLQEQDKTLRGEKYNLRQGKLQDQWRLDLGYLK